ncbi:MAG: DoxX family membrane protein [Verrucomicrobiales bacterium]|nr:DoxX family membrane protein [Verrucomicrobiales bacterium]
MVSITDFSNKQLAFVLARLALGANLFFHGVVRLPKLQGFVGGMEATFQDSMIPSFLVTPMAWLIPIVEFVLGLLLLLGIATRYALVGVVLLMILLITGCCLVENWAALNSQMILVILSCAMIAGLEHNRLALTGKGSK